jgi:phenylpyruvate tautomerase PptA (4-oxalocrotonate tautomerase family)
MTQPDVDRRLIVGALAGVPFAAMAGPGLAAPASQAQGVPVLVRVTSPPGVVGVEKRQALIKGITEVVIRVQGLPAAARPNLTVLVSETTEGGWGVAGHGYTLQEFPELVTKGARTSPG